LNFLKRELAPLTDEAWKYVEEEAVRALSANLSDRRVVDVSEPKGFDFSSVNLGTLSPSHRVDDGVHYGVRRVLPLVEIRVPIELDIWTLDNLSRGATDVDTDAVTQAALKISAFEEHAVYKGFNPAGIAGLDSAEGAEPLELGEEVVKYSDAAARAVLRLNDHGVKGPFAMVLGSKPFRLLHSYQSSDPPRRQIASMLDGPIWRSAVLEGGFVLSLRGGDFELTLGQDISLGYDWHDKAKVHLFLTETFTFRVLGPEAVVPLTFNGSL
jgi:uncharacterized linocin/CFP29 family protein